MIIFGLEIRRAPKLLSSVPSSPTGGWFNLIHEPFGGAWQRNVSVDSPRQTLAFSAVFSCVTLIASDIAKLRIKLVEEDALGICTEIKSGSPFLPVLTKPNRYQTRIKFMRQWMLSKLIYGNAYVLKGRDQRRMVNELWVLDPQRVTPLVAENGDVYYRLSSDDLSGIRNDVTVPASEIIHDSMNELFHPLVGVSPIYACAVSATQGARIQSNSTKFFDNMSRPSGILTSPTTIDDEEAAQYKKRWDENFSANNLGKVAILGGGLKYEPMTIPAQEAQLIEQLKWTVEDVGRCFHVPLFKLGGPVPTGNTVESLQQTYYNDCLQQLFEDAELCLGEGLGLAGDKYCEFDLDGLLRMDTAARYKSLGEFVGDGVMTPNEARARENLKAIEGGDACYLQQQNYSTAALAKRDALEDPFGTAPKPPAVPPADPEAQAAERVRVLMDQFREVSAMADEFIKGLIDG